MLIGVVGGSGSGKTTVARAIARSRGIDAVLMDQDSYYQDLGHLTLEERRRVNFDHPDAIDTELLIRHLEELATGRAVDKPTYDFVAHTRAAETIRVEPHEVVVVDGILLFVDARLRELFNLKIFVDVADDVRFIRRLRRDTRDRGRTVDMVIDQYLATVRPMHLEFVEPSKRHADIIIPEGGRNQVAIEMLQAQIERSLKLRRASG